MTDAAEILDLRTWDERSATRWGVPDDVPIALVVLDDLGNIVDRNRVADDLLYDGSRGLLRVGAPFVSMVSQPVRDYTRWRKQATSEPLEVRLQVGCRQVPVILTKQKVGEGATGHTLLSVVLHDKASHIDAHRLAFEVATTGTFVTEPSGHLLVANQAFLELMHVELDEVIGQDWQLVLFTGVPPTVSAEVSSSLRDHGEWSGRVLRSIPELGDRMLEMNLRLRPAQHSAHEAVVDSGARSMVGEVSDVTDARSVQGALRVRARSDYLTGLLNRPGFMAVLDERLAVAEHGGGQLTLLCVGIDSFPSPDDLDQRYHDLLLEAFAGRLRFALKSSDVLGRLSDDQFAVLFEPGLAPEILETIVASLRATLIPDYQLDDLSYRCSISCGAADYPRDAASRSELVDCVGQAVAHARSSGQEHAQRPRSTEGRRLGRWRISGRRGAGPTA